MSTNQKIESTETAAVAATVHTAAAQERIQELRQWREQIPRFTVPVTKAGARLISTAASVPPEFIELTSIATTNHRPLVRAESRTPEEVRDLVAYADAYSPLADELEALAKFIRYSAMTARNEAGAEALTIYALAVRLSKRPETAYLAPYVADMRRALGRTPSPEVRARNAAARAAKAAARAAAAQQLKPQA